MNKYFTVTIFVLAFMGCETPVTELSNKKIPSQSTFKDFAIPDSMLFTYNYDKDKIVINLVDNSFYGYESQFIFELTAYLAYNHFMTYSDIDSILITISSIDKKKIKTEFNRSMHFQKMQERFNVDYENFLHSISKETNSLMSAYYRISFNTLNNIMLENGRERIPGTYVDFFHDFMSRNNSSNLNRDYMLAYLTIYEYPEHRVKAPKSLKRIIENYNSTLIGPDR